MIIFVIIFLGDLYVDPAPPSKATPGSPCAYDEGSPLVQDVGLEDVLPTVVGILSKTDGCSAESYGVYTRVSVFYSWLLNTAGQQPIRPTPAPPTEEPTDP